MVVAMGEGAAAAVADAAGLEELDVAGATVLRGLEDAHVHAEQWAVARRRLDLRAARSPREVAALVAAAAADRPPGEAIVGIGFRDALWQDAPHKDLLAAAAPDRVVLLLSHDLHTAWCSPAALRAIDRGDHPTGLLPEAESYRATGLLQEHADADLDRWVADALAEAATLGVTRIADYEMGDRLPAWQRRAGQAPPTTRVRTTVYREHLDTALDRGLPSGTPVPGTDGLVTVGPLKLFADGALNSRTALCHDPYPGLVGTDHATGHLATSPDQLATLVRRATAGGLDVAIHAIGDRANTIALDAFEAAGRGGRIEHAQLLDPADVPRFATLGVVAGVQPAHLLDDRDVADRHWAGRTDRAFPFRDLAEAGVRMEFGSDAPVAPLDPWLAIVAAVARAAPGDEAWHPEQRLPVATALDASCDGRAELRVGDHADLCVVDRDPLAVDPDELRDVHVIATLLGGRWTHRVG
ncbi:MAG: amidohydrolase family protein [Actinobacteria bacterium]|nr:amidohydrolase family protein [Actinomycetota bacterium]